MGYDKAFFEAYKEYLNEPVVRANHDKAFSLFSAFCYDSKISSYFEARVLDLGCGTCEYRQHGNYFDYFGVDKHLVDGPSSDLMEADYLDLDLLNLDLDFQPNTFVSLFSIEPCVEPLERTHYYRTLFHNFPTLEYGLSSGFYYSSKKNQSTVNETGGIVSHQTLDSIDSFPYHPEFTEMRLEMATPSKMFGQDVIEVYKMFKRV